MELLPGIDRHAPQILSVTCQNVQSYVVSGTFVFQCSSVTSRSTDASCDLTDLSQQLNCWYRHCFSEPISESRKADWEWSPPYIKGTKTRWNWRVLINASFSSFTPNPLSIIYSQERICFKDMVVCLNYFFSGTIAPCLAHKRAHTSTRILINTHTFSVSQSEHSLFWDQPMWNRRA